MTDIFISYAREDLTAARRLAGTLESQDWSVFWDRHIPAGKSWRDVIGPAVDDARCVVVLWSKHSVVSRYVLEEAERGRERNVLIPALLEDIKPPFGFGDIHSADLSAWAGTFEEGEIKQFLRDVAAVLGAAPVVRPEDCPEAKGDAARKAEERQWRPAETDTQLAILKARQGAEAHANYGTEEAKHGPVEGHLHAPATEELDSRRRSGHRRNARLWPAVALVMVIATVVSLLLFLRVPTTEVTLALDLASLAFRIGDAPELGGDGRIDLLGRVNMDQMVIDDVDAVKLDDVPISDATDFRLRATGDGSISLWPLEVPVGTWVRVHRPDAVGGLTIELVHPAAELELALTLPPDVEILPPDSGLARAFDPSLGAQRAVFRAGRPEGGACARLRLRWPAAPSASTGADGVAPFHDALPIDVLLFTDVKGGRQRTAFSTILAGTLYLEAVGGEQIEIRRDQLLDVGLGSFAGDDPVQAREGLGFCTDDPLRTQTAPARILRLAVGADEIALQAAATVNRLSTGTATHRQNLMPRWLEWLQARQPMLLFWGAFTLLCGLAYTVVRWWRGSHNPAAS